MFKRRQQTQSQQSAIVVPPTAAARNTPAPKSKKEPRHGASTGNDNTTARGTKSALEGKPAGTKLTQGGKKSVTWADAVKKDDPTTFPEFLSAYKMWRQQTDE